jgi:outer membrane protein assembly factor BamB
MGQIGVKRDTDIGWAQGVSMAGQLLWESPLPSMPIQPAAYIADVDIFINTTKSGDVIALNAKDGSPLWRAKVGDDVQAAGTLFKAGTKWMYAVTSADGNFALLDAKTGADIKRLTVDKYCTSSPVFANGILYVTTAHRIMAYTGLDTFGVP